MQRAAHGPQRPAPRFARRFVGQLRRKFVRRQIAEARMRAHRVEVLSPALDNHLRFGRRAEPFELRHSSRNLPLKLCVTPFCQGLPGSINAVPMPCATIQDSSALDTNSGPLSLRRKLGTPRPLAQRSNTKSYDHTWFGANGACGRGRTAATRFLGHLRGTRKRTARHSRHARPGLIRCPSRPRNMRMRR